MTKKTLGTGRRATNGQYRRKSKFNPCGMCGVGTTFMLCVGCAEKVELHKPKRVKVEQGTEQGDIPGDNRATDWLQGRLFD